MKVGELSSRQKNLYYMDSDIFHIRAPKTPDKFKKIKSNLNRNTSSKNKLGEKNKKNVKYHRQIKDHVNECLRPKTPDRHYLENYQSYKRIAAIKEENRRDNLNKSLDFNFENNIKVYKDISNKGKGGNIILGNDKMEFNSEYRNMGNYAKEFLNSRNKKTNQNKKLNKSVDLPNKKKYNKRNVNKDMFDKNSTDYDCNKSFDSKKVHNKFSFAKSNIFFDKKKEKANEEYEKILNENNNKKKEEKLKNIELEKNKQKTKIYRKKKGIKLNDDNQKLQKAANIHEYAKIFREGSFPPKYSDYKPKTEVKLKSIDNEYNEKNNKLYKGISEKERNIDKYSIFNISNNDKFDPKELKNIFLKNGIHIFGEEIHYNVLENGKQGKYTFNIRKDINDKNFEQKLKKIQNTINKRQGVVLNVDKTKKIFNRTKREDISPTYPPMKKIKGNKVSFK